MSACWCLVLVVGIIHTQSPTSQSTPVPCPSPPVCSPAVFQQSQPSQSQSTPSCRARAPATSCQYLLSPASQRDKRRTDEQTDRHTYTSARTHARNCKSPWQAVKACLYLPNYQTSQPNSSRPGRLTGPLLEAESRCKERQTDRQTTARPRCRSEHLSIAQLLPAPLFFFILFRKSTYMLPLFFCFGCRQGHPYIPLRQSTTTLTSAVIRSHPKILGP